MKLNKATYSLCNSITHSCDVKFKPRVVKSMPCASVTRFGSVSIARMKANNPTIPYWSATIVCGIFDIVPTAA